MTLRNWKRLLFNAELGMRNSELFAELTFVGRCEANQLVELSTARQVSRGRKPFGRSPQRAKLPKLTAKSFAVIEKSLTAKKGAIHIKKVKRTMINKVRKTKM